jgi:hypothetical protein
VVISETPATAIPGRGFMRSFSGIEVDDALAIAEWLEINT